VRFGVSVPALRRFKYFCSRRRQSAQFKLGRNRMATTDVGGYRIIETALATLIAWAGVAGPLEAVANQTHEPSLNRAPSIQVQVDPRVELVSLIFRLAGNPEYNQGKVESYISDANERFGKFSEHKVVVLARKLRNTRGVSYDACMSLAVLMTDVNDPALRVPLEPWPESLDKRWNENS
jgi:hypothetical protein